MTTLNLDSPLSTCKACAKLQRCKAWPASGWLQCLPDQGCCSLQCKARAQGAHVLNPPEDRHGIAAVLKSTPTTLLQVEDPILPWIPPSMPYLVCEGNEDYEPGESPICHNSMCYLGLCTSIVDHMQYMGELAPLACPVVWH